MPASIAVGQTATAVLHEWTGAGVSGSEVAPIGPVTYSSSDTTIASIDPATGIASGLAAGTVTLTGSDAGNGLSATDTLGVVGAVAVSATLVITPNAVRR